MGRSVTHRKVSGGGLPLVARLMLLAAVVVLGGLALFTASGGMGRALAAIGSSLSGAIDALTATPTPRPSDPLVLDSPILGVPDEPYTNVPTADLSITVPAEFVGRTDTRIRIYQALGDQAAEPIEDVGMPSLTPQVVVPVALVKGANTFTVALLGPSGEESEPSASVRYVLDQEPPKVSLASPRNNATVNGRVVTLVGKTQARSDVTARNEANNQTAAVTAGTDGAFTLSLPLAAGTNGITISSIDPAGNQGELVVAVLRGSGKLTAGLSVTIYRISRKLLPEPIELGVLVNDPDGRPLEGALVTFTLSVPGIQTITSDATTGGDGRATFQTTIPRGATVGQGIATVLVKTEDLGTASDATVVTVTR
jgi:hypothetical protein